jgi:hypothetical protein
MVMIYWWAKDNSIKIDYEWAEQVRKNPFAYEDFAHSCGNSRRIPVYDETKPQPQTIDNKNC